MHTAHHRGRDQLVTEGEPQWLIGKFTYGMTDVVLEGEDVDVFVERGCAGSWEKLGTAITTYDGQHRTVEGVEDNGGRVYFEIPAEKALGLGRHRARLVVAGDHSDTDLIIDVVRPGAPIFVSDVDGTLTSSEAAETWRFLMGSVPRAQPCAAEALSALAAKGYRPVYLTARPEWLTERTRAFLSKRGFPTGVIHTTTKGSGGVGEGAARFKAAELAGMRAKGVAIDWVFGNQPSDTDAYDAAMIEPRDHRVFLGLHDRHGGRRIEGYEDILAELCNVREVCR
jgi:phosphatidate phosphatase PAH1